MQKQTVRHVTSHSISLSLPPTHRFLPLLLLLFVGSGCAALIYEIVWFQLIELVIGSSAVSLGVLLGTFMGGMCLGSLLLPRVVSPERHPLRVYAMLEAGIGVLGVVVLVAVPLVGGAYTATAPHGFMGVLLRGAVCAICLLPPTLLMGATLPAIARWVEATPTGVSWLGFFYGSNIAGAVFGCLLAGFYLLRVHDMSTTTFVAAAINFGVAGAGLLLSKRAPHRPAVHAARDGSAASAIAGTNAAYVAIACSGFAALGAEVVWTRLLSLMLGASVYTFSIILAVFLIALGFGSSAGAFVARAGRARLALAWTQLLVVGGVAWAAWLMARSLPYWPLNPMLSPSPWITFQVDLLRALCAVFPAAFLWGASFPLAIAAVVGPGQDAGRLVGRVYAANTVGAIAGSALFSVVVIPNFGTQRAEQLLIVTAIASAAVVFFSLVRSDARDRQLRRHSRPAPEATRNAAAILAAFVVAIVLATTVPKVPDGLVAYGRFLSTYTTEPKYLYVGEGMNSSIAVSEMSNGVRNFHVAGKVEASSEPQDMRLQRMLGHISALLDRDPQSVLVVGFGAGVTAGSFVLHPGIKRIVICEIEPLIPKVVAKYFTRENYNVVNDPRVQIVYDDARHFILTSKEKFDVITSDPIHPWVKGAATLYTKEYFELVKKHLRPGGVVTQWVPLYESYPGVVKSEIATFFKVFPDGTVWSNDLNGKGYDLVLAGHATPQTIDIDSLQRRMSAPPNGQVAQSLSEVGINSALSLLSTYGGQASDLAPWLTDAEINVDANLRLQYLAGMGLNEYENASIYEEMLKYRRYPESLFTGADSERAFLRQTLDGALPPP